MRLLTTYILVLCALVAPAQNPPIRNWVDTQVRYSDAAGNAVMVHSSLPKGGSVYTTAEGRKYSYVVFWFRVINESTAPVALRVRFPAEPFKIFPSPDSHIRLFLPPDSMTVEKIQLFNYGLANLESFLATEFNNASSLQRTIPPKGESLFYVPVLFSQARGTTRAALVLKGQDLFFKISVSPEVDSAMIPCGQLVFKK